MVVARSVACAAMALVVAAGCASIRAGGLRRQALERQLDEHRVAKPLDEVWQEARRLLAERGYPLAGRDAEAVGQEEPGWALRITSPARETTEGARGGGLLGALGVLGTMPAKDASQATSVRSLDTGWNTFRERYRLEGRQGAGGCQVIFTRLKEDPADRRADASRDLEMELALTHRVDPEAAARIEASLRSPAAGGG